VTLLNRTDWAHIITARNYMRLIAHCDLYRRIPRLMGPQLYKMRNVPYVLPEDTPLAARVEETLRTVKIYATARRYRPDVAGALPLSRSGHTPRTRAMGS
jgi:hypothetical protein